MLYLKHVKGRVQYKADAQFSFSYSLPAARKINTMYSHVHIELEKVCDTISEQVQRTCPQLILPLAGSPEDQTHRSFPGYWMIMMRGNMMR